MKHSTFHRKGPKKLPACGTSAGYEGHLKRRERPCARCLVGSSTYTIEEINELIGRQYDRDRDQQLWNTYRLSLDRFAEIFKQQGERCACCGSTNPGEAAWNIDHDHDTRQIRGILCLKCNTGIGSLGDNLAGVHRALVYLQAHHERGGHALAEKGPPPKGPPPISAVMQRCFELFQIGLDINQMVRLLQLTPEQVKEIHTLWKNGGGEIIPPRNQHMFKLGRDPFRCMCSCGLAIECDEKDTDAVMIAVNKINVHVKEGNSPESNWMVLRLEEKARREEKQRRAKEEIIKARDQAREDALRRKEQRDLEERLRLERRTEREQHTATKKRWNAYLKR